MQGAGACIIDAQLPSGAGLAWVEWEGPGAACTSITQPPRMTRAGFSEEFEPPGPLETPAQLQTSAKWPCSTARRLLGRSAMAIDVSEISGLRRQRREGRRERGQKGAARTAA